jgi:Domain of unknown function (DUF4280)
MSEIAPKSKTIAEIKAENSKQMVEVREKRKEKEKAEEDQQFVIDMAVLECKLCTNPVGMLKVNYDTPTIQGKKTATVKEKDSKSLIFMGTCIKSPYQASPCASVMQLGEWQDIGTMKSQDEYALIKKSTIMCNYGGSKIAITKSGQINVPSQIGPESKSSKEIVSIEWMCDEVKEKLEGASLNDKVSLLVKTKNYKEGDAVFLDITKEDGEDLKEGTSRITVTGKVKADGTAELKQILHIENI